MKWHSKDANPHIQQQKHSSAVFLFFLASSPDEFKSNFSVALFPPDLEEHVWLLSRQMQRHVHKLFAHSVCWYSWYIRGLNEWKQLSAAAAAAENELDKKQSCQNQNIHFKHAKMFHTAEGM